LRGRFITFEGGEGSGKSTQAQLLARVLAEDGTDLILTREPGGSAGAEEIRKLIVEGEPGRWNVEAEMLLFMAARSDHIAKLILPALENGRWVICDRFIDSSVVYQGIVRGYGMGMVQHLNISMFSHALPDLTLVFDIDHEVGLARAKERGAGHMSRFDKFGPDFHARIRDAYREIAATDPNRCVVVDAGRGLKEIHDDVMNIVAKRFFR